MNSEQLYHTLSKAGDIEESMVGALAKIIGFYLGDDSGLSAEDLGSIRSGLDELKRDTEKHRRILAEVNLLVEGGSGDK